MNKPMKYRVILVSPSAVALRGLASLLGDYPEFEVVGALADFSQLPARMVISNPDVAVIDPVVFDYAKRRSPRSSFPFLQDCTLVAMVTASAGEEMLKGYDAAIDLYDGQVQIIHKLRRAAATGKPDPEAGDQDELSQREKEILIAVARGKTNKEIAGMHNISVHTVISHRKNISRKTGIKSVAGLTVYAMLNNLIDQTEV